MRIEKERNIVRIYLDGSNSPYTLDLNTAVMLGVKGAPLKNTPKPSDMKNQFRTLHYNRNLSNVGFLIWGMIEDYHETRGYREYLTALSVADRLDSINAPCLNWRKWDYENLNESWKDFVQFTKSDGFDWDACSISSYNAWKNAREFAKKYGKAVEGLTAPMLNSIKSYHNEITAELLEFYQYYLVRGKYWEYHRTSISNLVEYLNMCAYMDKKPEKVNNFMREYIETKQSYERRKEEYNRQRFTNVYGEAKEMLTFEYGNLQVVIPTCPQDLINEGERQRNCVGGYVNTVLNGNTYVVFVRHKDNLDKNYITCEVTKSGVINQFYLARNNYVELDEDRMFRQLYAEHIKNILAEMKKANAGGQ